MPVDAPQLTMLLGEAVKRSWGSLPRDVQEMLFEDALGGDAEGEVRESLAIMLHDSHPRTST